MANKRKKLVRELATKTGMSYQAALQTLSPKLRMFTDGDLYLIGSSLADCKNLPKDHVTLSASDFEVEWWEVPADELLSLREEDPEAEDLEVTRTAREWVVLQGRGFFATTEPCTWWLRGRDWKG